jgi:hypothetical protein
MAAGNEKGERSELRSGFEDAFVEHTCGRRRCLLRVPDVEERDGEVQTGLESNLRDSTRPHGTTGRRAEKELRCVGAPSVLQPFA